MRAQVHVFLQKMLVNQASMPKAKETFPSVQSL